MKTIFWKKQFQKKKSVLKWEDLKLDFSFWYKENIDDKIPKAKTIKQNFEKKLKKEVMSCKKKDENNIIVSIYGWNNYKIKQNDE